jgi:hypothetical protein
MQFQTIVKNPGQTVVGPGFSLYKGSALLKRRLNMKRKRPTEDAIVESISAWEVLASVGICAMQMIESIQYAEHSDDWSVLEDLAHQMDGALVVQAQFCMENERLLKLINVELPPNMVTIRTKNPLFRSHRKESTDDESDSPPDDLGELPF